MFRNYLAAALRNLMRNRLYAILNILGLAVGFAAALLIAAFVRDEFSYDTFLPGHGSVYLLTQTITTAGRTPAASHRTPLELVDALKLDFPEIQTVARIVGAAASIRRGEVESNETLYWADPEIFDLLPFPAVAGDVKNALHRPDGVVLTRRMARKFFGFDNPVGATIEVNREHPMVVAAVIEDLPSNTHFAAEIIASGLADFSIFGERKVHPIPAIAWIDSGYTYLRLAPGVAAHEVQARMPAFLDSRMKQRINQFEVVLGLTPLTRAHLTPDNSARSMKPVGDATADYALAAIGVLILAVAGINFVNLMTARAGCRAVEVGVRKTTGAARRHLMVQFLGESLAYATCGALGAAVIAFLLWPWFNVFLDRHIALDPMLCFGSAGIVLFVGALAGFYPAVVLAAFRPAAALRKHVNQGAGARVRKGLVVVQFAILIGLVAGVAVMYRQMSFALSAGLRLDTDQTVLVETRCGTSFVDRVRVLPGVIGAACAQVNGLSPAGGGGPYGRSGAAPVNAVIQSVDAGYFELFGLQPLAGRFASRDYPADFIAADFTHPDAIRPHAVLNETAARRYGFARPTDAVGATLTAAFGLKGVGDHGPTVEIIGVVPDFSFDTIHILIPPIIYFHTPGNFRWLTIKLKGSSLPETLDALDAAWKEAGEPHPIRRLFLDQEVGKLYLDIERQSEVFAAFTSVALFIAVLGLFGLSAFAAEQRTKEIGVRKALGAGRGDILRLLLWDFTKPVLWANAVAWPAAFLIMRRWLEGFAYHVDLSPWIFVGASAMAVVIAILTVSGHALLVARGQPVAALRYE